MKKILFIAGLFLAAIKLQAQTSFPKSAKEDIGNDMSEAYWKLWNPQVQNKIDKDIEANRKADATIKLDEVKRGTQVKVEQISHDFIFGAHTFNFDQLGSKELNQKYRDVFGSLFNRGTVAFYWKTFEMQPGRKRYSGEYWDSEEYWDKQTDPKNQPHWRRPATDPVVDFLISKGVKVHGHPLIWGSRRWMNPTWIISDILTSEEKKEMDKYISQYPDPNDILSEEKYTDAYKDLTVAELNTKFPTYGKKLNELFEKRIRDIIKYYGSRVDSWDVVNESACDFAYGHMNTNDKLIKSDYGIMPGDYTYKAFKIADEVIPDGVWKNINDYWTGPEYAKQIKDLINRGIKIDIAGSQMHLFNPQQCIDIAAGKDIQTPTHVWNLMNDIASSGLPICLSEITITSPTKDHHGQMIQAIIAQNLYRIWFSIKEMQAITWWNIVDDCGAPGEPSVSGLFSRDMKRKLSYYALDNLINHEWKTNLTLKADKNGNIKFRGFKGNYRITYINKNGDLKEINYYVK